MDKRPAVVQIMNLKVLLGQIIYHPGENYQNISCLYNMRRQQGVVCLSKQATNKKDSLSIRAAEKREVSFN